MNILITNIGRRGYLVDYIKEVPEFSGNIYVSDCDSTASGLYGDNDGYFILPKPVDDELLYTKELRKLCLEKNITAIIPVIDPEIFILSKYRDEFLKEGINIIVSNKNVLDICYNKLLMNDFLEQNGFAVPKTYTSVKAFKDDYDAKLISFPIMIKPVYGSGSAETYKIENMESLESLFHEGMMIQEFLKATEYGVDVFNTFEKTPVRCVVKKKISMRSGETDKSLLVEDKDIQNMIITLAKLLGHIANLDCDVMKTADKMYVIDMNPRFGGGYPATHASGCNLLSIIVKLLNDEKIVPDFDSYKKNLLVMKEIKIRTHEL